MADNFRASFVLALKDDLSGGLRRIIAEVKQFQSLVKSLGFRPLEGADAIVDKLGRDVQQLNRGLGATARQADTAAGAIRRIGTAELGRAQQTAASLRLQAALARQAAAAAGYGGGGTIPLGGRGQLLLSGPGSPGGGGGPLMLAGPGGDAPFDERFNTLRRRRNPFAGLAGRARDMSKQIGLMGSAMAGIGLEAPIHAAAELDQTLRQIAILGGKHGAAASAEIERLRTTLGADSLETGQPIQQLAEAYMDLRSRGNSSDVVDKLLPVHSRAATAYHVSAESMGAAVSALHQNLGISEDDMGGALAAMAQASHEGKFSMADMSRYMPTIAGRMDVMGMHGRGNLDKAAAGLAVVSRNSADPSATATNFTDMMIAMTQPYARKAFQKSGIDLQGIMTRAEQHGQDPMEAYIGILEKMTANVHGDIAKAFVLGKVLHNQQAGTAALSLLQHRDEYIKLRDELHGIGADKLSADYKTAMEGMMADLNVRGAKIKAIEQELGIGFAWTVPASSFLLGGVVVAMTWLDRHLPGVTTLVLGLTGGMLGLVAIMGVLGTVAGPVKAGFILLGQVLKGVFSRSALRLLVSPWLTLPLLMGAAAYDIIEHWSYFQRSFYRLWGGVLQMLHGVAEFVSGTFAGDMARAAAGLHGIWNGVKQAWIATWAPGGIMEKLFGDFATWVDGWSGGLATQLGTAMGHAFDALASVVRAGLDGLKTLFDAFKPDLHLPTAPFMAPQGGPDSFPRYQPPTALQDGRNADHESHSMPLAQKSAYRAGGDGGAMMQRIHVTFTSDTPGQAAVEHSGGSGQARGRMLIRA